MSNEEKLPDEQSSTVKAQKVITNKRLYFLPDQSISVEAESVEEAVAEGIKAKKVKEGDA